MPGSRPTKRITREMLGKHFKLEDAPAWEEQDVIKRIRSMPLSERLKRAYTLSEHLKRPESQRALAREIIRGKLRLGTKPSFLDAYTLAKKHHLFAEAIEIGLLGIRKMFVPREKVYDEFEFLFDVSTQVLTEYSAQIVLHRAEKRPALVKRFSEASERLKSKIVELRTLFMSQVKKDLSQMMDSVSSKKDLEKIYVFCRNHKISSEQLKEFANEYARDAISNREGLEIFNLSAAELLCEDLKLDFKAKDSRNEERHTRIQHPEGYPSGFIVGEYTFTFSGESERDHRKVYKYISGDLTAFVSQDSQRRVVVFSGVNGPPFDAVKLAFEVAKTQLGRLSPQHVTSNKATGVSTEVGAQREATPAERTSVERRGREVPTDSIGEQAKNVAMHVTTQQGVLEFFDIIKGFSYNEKRHFLHNFVYFLRAREGPMMQNFVENLCDLDKVKEFAVELKEHLSNFAVHLGEDVYGLGSGLKQEGLMTFFRNLSSYSIQQFAVGLGRNMYSFIAGVNANNNVSNLVHGLGDNIGSFVIGLGSDARVFASALSPENTRILSRSMTRDQVISFAKNLDEKAFVEGLGANRNTFLEGFSDENRELFLRNILAINRRLYVVHDESPPSRIL